MLIMWESTSQPGLTGKPQAQPAPEPYYQSFLLRMWRERPNGVWRASLENVISGEKHVFGQLDQLLNFLETGETPLHERQATPDTSLPAK